LIIEKQKSYRYHLTPVFIGQDKPVFVYKLIIEDSVEEKILALQTQKKERANALYSEKEEATSMDAASLLELFG